MTAEPVPVPESRSSEMAAIQKRIDRVNTWLQVGGALPLEDYERLRAAGVTHVIDLREDDDPGAIRLQDLGIARRHIPVPNHAAPTMDQLVDVAGWFAGQDAGASLYVHCQGGFGRAGTMAVGLLVHAGLSVDDAERIVRAARPEIRINDEQRSWLLGVEAQRGGTA